MPAPHVLQRSSDPAPAFGRRDQGHPRIGRVGIAGDQSRLDQRAPALENDFDSMVWWVRSTDGVTPNVNLQSCPDALTPVFREPS